MSKILFLKLFSIAFAAMFAAACGTSTVVQTPVQTTVQIIVEDDSCLEPKTECLEYLREAVEQGRADAQFSLGWMYDNGEGVEKDDGEAARLYRLSAKQGFADAQFSLGWIYRIGIGVTVDKIEAIRWFQLAAKQRHVEAQINLGFMHSYGEGVDVNFREAFSWYQLAAEQGDAVAQSDLGVMYTLGKGVKKDEGKAARWLRLAGEQGVVVLPEYDFDVTYDNGTEAAAGKREAARWFRLAAEQGGAWAQFGLGWMHNYGVGVTMDKREAARWFQLAAEQGDEWAQSGLILMYLTGKGVIQDFREAYIWSLITQASGGALEDYNEVLQAISSLLTPAEIKSAKREAVQRLEEIESGNNRAQNTDDSQQKGGEFAIAKPPEETNIAAAVFENTWRSVVMIKDNEGQGSGVIIRSNLVATNCHVVEGGGVSVYKPENGRIDENVPFSAKVVYRKEEHDFCILEVKGLWGIAATIRKYDTLKVGENVYALGAPSGLDLSLSNGLISQLRIKGSMRFIQTDAAISPGSSGGGLFDTKGNFIGILTSKDVGEDVEGIGFAIPADLVLKF